MQFVVKLVIRYVVRIEVLRARDSISFNALGSFRTDTQLLFTLHFNPLGVIFCLLICQPIAFLVLENKNLLHI